ncbi:MAG: ATP-binding protein [Halobacteriovoraceae bacterium]|jgi:DNA replication protein DnaC|nr:ATP-binding protein [Halobacteriovoraceae bacterium]
MKDATNELLKELKLSTFISNLKPMEKKADKGGWSYEKFLKELSFCEIDHRKEMKTARLLKQSKIPPQYTFETLDQKLLSSKVRKAFAMLLKGEFINEASNILAFGLPGRGKSHLLGALGRELILKYNISVYFTPTFKIVEKLLIAKKEYDLENALKRLDKFDVIILDDIGYVQQSRDEMEVLFTLLADRYERKSLMISSNLVFSKWDKIFKDPMTTMAAVDRLIHHSTILEFDWDSIRAMEAKKRKQ